MVYIYEHQGANQWNLIQEIEAPNAHEGQLFGDQVAIANGTLVVSAKFDQDNYYDQGGISNARGHAQGSVYIYEVGNNWAFLQKLIPNEGDGHKWDAFGTSLALRGDIIAVGASGTDNTTYKAPGRVYIFQKNADSWIQTTKIEALDGKTEDFFGASLALDETILAVTAPGSYNSLVPDLSKVEYGAAYVFRRSGDLWSEEAKLLPEEVKAEDSFGGSAIALHENFLIVGAALTEVVTKSNGAAYFFDRNVAWEESHRIVAPDPLNEDLFGASIAATPDLVFVGAHRRCNQTGCWAGALYFVE